MVMYGVDERRVAGYEYHYDFSVDDEIVNLYKFEYHRGRKTYLFEIRTSFVMKTIEGEDKKKIIMDSERFDAKVYGDMEYGLMVGLDYRLAEYWMTTDEIKELVNKAFNFAVQTANNDTEHASKWLIPIVINLEVCTVQQEGETVDSVKDRAIREERLIPYVIFTRAPGRKNFDRDLLLHLSRLMNGTLKIVGKPHPGKIRVADVGEAMVTMPVCEICCMSPLLGTYITVLPKCKHAFHSHCIVRRLLAKDYRCPTCQVPAYPYVGGLRGIMRRRPIAP